jgi:serine protease
MGTVGAVALIAAACQPVAPPPTPPPPPPPSTCDSSSQATPTPQHPVDYAVVVRHAGWAAPQVTSFTATSEADKNAHVAQLQTTGTVLAVGPNKTLTAQDTPINPTPSTYADYSQQWGLHPSPGGDFQSAWDQGFTGTGQTIAIVDTGVDLSHAGLAGRVKPGRDFVQDPSTTGTALVTGDLNGHGTHVAGIAADNDSPSGGLGGAPTAKLLAVRVLDQYGQGTDQAVANGIIWAATPIASGGGGATVINLSLGAQGCDAVLQTAADTAESDGAVVVAAAGNSSSNGLFSPAADTNEVLAVAATDSNGNLASFSNFGGYVAIAGPGVSVLSTCAYTPSCIQSYDTHGNPVEPSSDTVYGDLSGTSMATPFVSAAVALIKEECQSPLYTTLSASPPYTALNAIKALLQHHSGGAVPGEAFNRLDAGAAVAANCPASP